MKKSLLLTGLLVAVVAGPALAGADQNGSKGPKFKGSADVVEVAANPTTVTSAPGQRITFDVKIDIREHWHLYAHEDTSFIGIDLVPAEGFPLQRLKAQYPAGKEGVFFGEPTVMLEGKQVVKVSALVPGSLAKGEHALDLALTVQACDDKRCLAPADLPLQVSLKVE